MTIDPTEEAARRRAVRRRRLQRRQTMIFGVLLATVLAVALLAAAMWSSVIPSPFTRPFSSEAPTETAPPSSVPCPPPDAVPAPFGEISAGVYNATTENGLAARAAGGLTQYGVAVRETANYAGSIEGTARIVTGPRGLRAAHTLAAVIPGSEVALDGREDETVDVVVGPTFDSLPSPAETTLDPAEPLPVPAGCSLVTVPEEPADPEESTDPDAENPAEDA